MREARDRVLLRLHVKVLIAHSDPDVRSALAAALARLDAELLEVDDEKTLLAACREQLPDVVLADLGTCRNGPEPMLNAIKGDADLFRTSVVIMCSELDPDLVARAQARGAEDVLRLPAEDAEVIARVRAAERAGALRDQLLERERGLEELAYNDELTRLYNRRFLGRQLSALVRSATRHRRTLSCVLVDIDRFKSINDDHGHARGDAVLARVASRLQHVLREEDYAGRWGGEEFLILLPDIDEDGAHATAERLRASVGDRPVAGLRVTVSAGVATWAPGESPDDLLRRADAALYAAKRGGRDQVAQAAS
jgi:two-component system cell cycle response regulator